MNTIEQAARRLAQLRSAGMAADEVKVPIALEREPAAVEEPSEQATSTRFIAADGGSRSAPAIASPRVDFDLHRLAAMGFVTPQAPSSRRAEEFRMIKRPLLTNARGNSAAPIKHANRIMVTSALPREGKTFVSTNLALSMALERDTTVLLIDADATRPAILERLGLQPMKGLLDALSDPTVDVQSLVLETNIERLSILPAGTLHPQATEFLASEGMNMLIEQLASQIPNRVLIFDAPPLLGSTESRVLAAHMGQIVLVIEADRTPQRQVLDALATLENCAVVMPMLNKSSSSEAGSYYGSRTH